ncbi:TSC22 domain family protein 1-like isoform X1 [Myxocyprinus asiaticus]|uniref:TSC22 domain family protein 1-like isoform X1 n=1 Tax=Myxocyprinus asiaticus TaxID=70543 RepID=UPI002223BC5F|nr:TSC22 domain family protein 1-like isoform X1 [Myxocyprinus asiaticus]
MHHSDSPGETPSSRRMSHPSVFAGRRGSNPTSGATVSINCPVAPAEDHQTAGMMPHAAPTGSSSPGPHHPPHSLNIHPQGQTVGAQVKKKSGFQITSVLPAQVSASANNSIADDTESYDDMDESHTEDLSSSDILDVSVSRATDTGVPERSSSEETLNSLHGGETPGVASPNEPVLHHPQQGYMANGVHHHAHHHHHQPHGHHKEQVTRPVAAGQVRPASLASTGASAQRSGRSTQASVVDSGGTAAVSHPVASTGSVVGTATEVGGGAGPTGSATVPPAQLPPPTTTTTQTQMTAAATGSRFRVVKLDSNSEPFRKGRWMCAEYYEKDAPPGDTTVAAHRTVETIIQSEHETTSGSSSGSTLSGGGDVQQTYATHTTLPSHPQDPSAHPILQPAVAPLINPQAVTVTGVIGTESSSAPVRPQQPVSYTVEGQIPQMQSSYPSNVKPAVSVTQSGMAPMEYAQMPTAQPLQIPPIQTAVSPRATPVPIGIPGLPVGAPVAVPQPVSPRLQALAPQMGTITTAQLHSEQQPASQLSTSTSSVPSGSNMPSSAAAQSLHGAAIPGRPAVLGQQGTRVPPSSVSYSGMSAVTASQLEDAQRLLLQHHPLLSLPRLAAGGMTGLTGQTAADAGATLGPDASADVSAAAISTGGDDDSSSGASVVAIDNKIEQAMDLVKSHLMYAVREEVEVLKEQIKELIERNSQLEQENTLLKNLASPEQLAQFQQQVQTASPTSGGAQTGPLTQSQGPGPTA